MFKRYSHTPEEFAQIAKSMCDVPRTNIKTVVVGRFTISWGGKVAPLKER